MFVIKVVFFIVLRKFVIDIIVGDEICMWFWIIVKGELFMECVNIEKVEYI